MQRKHATLREMGAYRLLALWYPSVVLGFLFVVLILGHSLSEGWEFLKAHKGLGIAFLVFPIGFIVFHWLMDRLMRLIGVDDGPPTAAYPAATRLSWSKSGADRGLSWKPAAGPGLFGHP